MPLTNGAEPCGARLPGLTVLLIVGLAYLYNYSGMVHAARRSRGRPRLSHREQLSRLARVLLTGATRPRTLFGNLQVAAAHQLDLNPIPLAATNFPAPSPAR
jgi:lactate permease